MSLNRTNLFLSIAMLAAVGVAMLSRVNYAVPNYEIMPDMKYSEAWTAFERNPNFASGRTLQAPPTGTVARGQMPLYYQATKDDAVRAGKELQNPFVTVGEGDTSKVNRTDSVRSASTGRGRRLYQKFCVCCHGSGGAGDGTITKRGFPPPPSLLSGKSQQMKDGQLFHILTYGQGNMEPLAGQMSRRDRWDAINFVRSMQSKAKKPQKKP